MNILEAMNDKQLFASTFKRKFFRGDTFVAWRAFLAALFALPMDDTARAIFEKHTGRADAPSTAFRECFVIAGRRSGKSLIAALVAVFLACFCDYSGALAPGEIGTIMILGSDRRQCRVILGYIDAFLSVPMLASLLHVKLKESIELTNGIRIEIHTASFRAVRGYTIVAAILDELAYWRSDESANPDSETLIALRPAMATIPNALLLGISSPYSRRGALYGAYLENYGKASETLIWKSPSKEMNPTLSPVVVAAAYLRDASAARAEYGGEFRDDIESYISPEVVEACTIAGRHELPFSSKFHYVGFCDPSGGRADSFGLAVAHREGNKAVLDLLREVVPPFSPEAVVEEFCGDLQRYGIRTVTGDRYGGEWPREQFAKRKIEYRCAEKNRSELYLELLPALTSGSIELLDHPKLAAQLASLERRTGRSGKDAIDHAPGSHDDVANCVAGALVEILEGSSGEMGLVEVLKLIGAGKLAEDGSPLKQPSALKAASPMFTGPGAPPCPTCKSDCVVRIGAALHCNECGVDIFPDGKPVNPAAYYSRGHALRGVAPPSKYKITFPGGRS